MQRRFRLILCLRAALQWLLLTRFPLLSWHRNRRFCLPGPQDVEHGVQGPGRQKTPSPQCPTMQGRVVAGLSWGVQ
uniref:Putative secreted protein n=1 Tax=Ixodes ricinus TaxID=34613 RepID=A0A6B0U433_IXORI